MSAELVPAPSCWTSVAPDLRRLIREFPPSTGVVALGRFPPSTSPQQDYLAPRETAQVEGRSPTNWVPRLSQDLRLLTFRVVFVSVFLGRSRDVAGISATAMLQGAPRGWNCRSLSRLAARFLHAVHCPCRTEEEDHAEETSFEVEPAVHRTRPSC